MTENIITYDEYIARKELRDEPSGHDPGDLPDAMFGFQSAIVRWALRRGRAGIFADTGLGKTLMQSAWAADVARHTGGDVLIVAPLCVSQQTVRESARFGLSMRYCRSMADAQPGITITNYEMADHFDFGSFAGLVLDESSILKGVDSKTRARMVAASRCVPYRLSCTATPAPNDHVELGAQADFLGVMSQAEMLATFFTHDGGDTSKWRLKKHGANGFWEWLASWAAIVRRPSDLGFDDAGFALPPYETHHHVIDIGRPMPGELFAKNAATLMERRAAQRGSVSERVDACSAIVNASRDQWAVWCHLNAESDALASAIPDSVAITGSDSVERKERGIMGFVDGDIRVLVTKPKIAGFGLNLQFCHDMAFVGLNDSYEAYYQCVRRCWRFGQDERVNVHLFSADTEGNVKDNLAKKEEAAKAMSDEMAKHVGPAVRSEVVGESCRKSRYSRRTDGTGKWTMHLGDCVDVVGEMSDSTIDYSIFSPPFASLYTYSDSPRDMGNCVKRSEFYEHYRFIVGHLLRVTKPGRLLSFHCMNLPSLKAMDGVIGLIDFRGELIRMMVDLGWIFHSEVCIWKDPVTSMHRTKALGLLHKTIRKDSSMARQGIPDYLVTVRKPGENPEPISHTHAEYPVKLWQRVASPVWMDINQSNTLQYRSARENNDERHICPLQLQVIERAINLWTNPGDLVLSPFAGIGSEGHVAVKMGRRFVGAELKRSYYDAAVKNLRASEIDQIDLFSIDETGD